MDKIYIKVIPNSKKELIEKISENNFKIKVKEEPKKGRANEVVKRKLADYFNLTLSEISLVSGKKSNNKIYTLNGTSSFKN